VYVELILEQIEREIEIRRVLHKQSEYDVNKAMLKGEILGLRIAQKLIESNGTYESDVMFVNKEILE